MILLQDSKTVCFRGVLPHFQQDFSPTSMQGHFLLPFLK